MRGANIIRQRCNMITGSACQLQSSQDLPGSSLLQLAFFSPPLPASSTTGSQKSPVLKMAERRGGWTLTQHQLIYSISPDRQKREGEASKREGRERYSQVFPDEAGAPQIDAGRLTVQGCMSLQ